MAKNSGNKKTPDPAGKIFLLDKFVCAYIRDNWIDWTKPIEPQSKELGVHRHILTKLQSEDGYRIPLSTLAIMCFYKNISLSDFFQIIEDKHGSKINDDFVSKSVKGN
ncbi:helix-turn-helix transcriptional regulator [Flavobacterium sp. J372]|uniref:helix-turn-helix transcriptional regulator n=1 Tax=Flavobacterium sp. J372 TaxID=2898436 RepID=UPI002151C266|nr:helix-turn-helix transcriptional regulator [Flavobacterium sp. J372]MCR5863505.1 helix-turn-helix transcriptional regulator [Flavobacterium sp. J372]